MAFAVSATMLPVANAATGGASEPAATQQSLKIDREYSNTVGVTNKFTTPIRVTCLNNDGYSFTLQPGERLYNHWSRHGQSHAKVLTFTTKAGAELGTVTVKGDYVDAHGKKSSGAHVSWKTYGKAAVETTSSTQFTNPVTVLDVHVAQARVFKDHTDYPVNLVVAPGTHG